MGRGKNPKDLPPPFSSSLYDLLWESVCVSAGAFVRSRMQFVKNKKKFLELAVCQK